MVFFCLIISPNLTVLAFQQAEYEIKLISPGNGDAVQGLVEIFGTTKTDDFIDYELSFSLMNDGEKTWFPINYSQESVDEDTLAEWNTSTLTDGSYAIRLIVNLVDQAPIIIIIEEIRVRNYTPIETPTPSPTGTSIPGELPTATASPIPPTATSLPANPAEVVPADINRALSWGISITFGLLLTLGLYSFIKRR